MTKQVSLQDIYIVVNRLEDKMDIRLKDVESRVDILEDFRGRILGMAAVVSAFVGLVSAWIWRKVTGEPT